VYPLTRVNIKLIMVCYFTNLARCMSRYSDPQTSVAHRQFRRRWRPRESPTTVVLSTGKITLTRINMDNCDDCDDTEIRWFWFHHGWLHSHMGIQVQQLNFFAFGPTSVRNQIFGICRRRFRPAPLSSRCSDSPSDFFPRLQWPVRRFKLYKIVTTVGGSLKLQCYQRLRRHFWSTINRVSGSGTCFANPSWRPTSSLLQSAHQFLTVFTLIHGDFFSKYCFLENRGYRLKVRSRDSVICIATGYGLDDRGVGVRVPVGSRFFSSSRDPNGLWGPPNLLSNAYRGLFPRG
jgi:hypothetical protein